jgi:hypothetical protein
MKKKNRKITEQNKKMSLEFGTGQEKNGEKQVCKKHVILVCNLAKA